MEDLGSVPSVLKSLLEVSSEEEDLFRPMLHTNTAEARSRSASTFGGPRTPNTSARSVAAPSMISSGSLVLDDAVPVRQSPNTRKPQIIPPPRPSMITRQEIGRSISGGVGDLSDSSSAVSSSEQSVDESGTGLRSSAFDDSINDMDSVTEESDLSITKTNLSRSNRSMQSSYRSPTNSPLASVYRPPMPR